jgi:hypothetical protein
VSLLEAATSERSSGKSNSLIPRSGYIPQPRVVAPPRTLGYQPDFVLTLKALYNGTT